MDADGQVDSLHLTEENYSKIEKLSIFEQKKEPTAFPDDSRTSGISSHKIGTLSILREEYGPSKKNEENTNVRRSGRRKSAPARWNGKSDLTKQISPVSDNLAAIKKYDLDRLVNKSSSLETIFAETQKNESGLRNVMSLRKLSRSVSFSGRVSLSPRKIEKRQLKASKVKPEKRLSTEVSLEKIRKKLSKTFID
ncbi:hypothetical protein WA026_008762 [Henosepilachna vigintioctopunctata]|uniref:Uncharacterized protein n=1 Tax=Henosepilachna vigintioctopunctata TaxID=420089 RepID=A0AAW1VC62_9CUCU